MRYVKTLLVVFFAFGLLVSMGCNGDGGGDDFADVTRADVENRAFTIDFDIDDDLETETATLTIGDFDADGDGNPNTAVFSLIGTVEGVELVVGGTFTIGASCIVNSTFGAIEGEEPMELEADDDTTAVLDPCEIDADGRLRFVDEDGELTISDPSTPAGVVFNLDVALSPDNEVEPAEPLDDRPETGTATLRLLSGNILEYAVTVNDLTAGDTLTSGHIHTGGVTENGGIFLTLVNAPVQFGRTGDIQFNGGSSVTASIVLSPEEVADLTNADSPFYVNVHSEQVPAGIVRGQIRE